MSDKFLIFSDLHVHNHSSDWRRVKDGLATLEWIHDEAVSRKIDKVFFLGDFFHVRGDPGFEGIILSMNSTTRNTHKQQERNKNIVNIETIAKF